MYAADEHNEPTRALAVVPAQRGGIVMPLVDVKAAQAAIKAFEDLKSAIIRPDIDIQLYKGHQHLKKSFWRRAGNFFGLSVMKVSEQRYAEVDGTVRYEAIYRATAPNGQFMDGDGACTTTEKVDKNGRVIVNTEHNTRATAHTRAKNRAISDLIGGGEVSAEELPDDDDDDRSTRAQARQIAARNVARNGKPAYLIGSNMDDNDRFKALGLHTPAAVKGFLVEHGVNLDALTRAAVTGALDSAERDARTVDAAPAGTIGDPNLEELGEMVP